jgi:hypothetical protein
MPSLRGVFAAAAFTVCASCALAVTPTKQDALRAISVLERNLLGPEAADAAKTVVVYAQVSDDVMVDIGPEQLPWLSEEWGLDKERETTLHSLLLAAFVAGDVKPQIKNDKAGDDTYSGWIFAIETYRRLQSREHFRSPSIEALAKMQAEGTLLQHAKEVHEDDDEPSAAERKPFA